MKDNLVYLQYINNNSDFYEKSNRDSSDIQYIVNRLPEDWYALEDVHGNWKYYNHKDIVIQDQGWKIHISANLNNAQEILDVVSEILINKKISFKHVPNKGSLLFKNSKNGNRVSSGKFITIYPKDEQFMELLKLLELSLNGFEKGPHILSDKRWKDTNIYYRYGAFKELLSDDGTLCIKNPEDELVPDLRTPYYRVPAFIEEPEELKNNLVISNSETQLKPSKLKEYKIKSSLRFTNGGGIYLAVREKDNINVVIKEARPHVGLDGEGNDAVSRLEIECKNLEKLSDVDGVVNVLDYFQVWEHFFLVEEYVEGVDLGKWISINYPFHMEQDKPKYVDKVIKIITKLKSLLINVHERNVGIGDFQPSNIMVNDELDVKLIDFESAGELNKNELPSLFTAGFTKKGHKSRSERDWYALEQIAKYCLLPLSPVHTIDESIELYHYEWIENTFGKECCNFIKAIKYECDSHIQQISLKSTEKCSYINKGKELTYHTIAKGLRQGIISNCSMKESLISGDVRQFEAVNGNYNVLTGGFGAILSLYRTGGIPPICTKWINYVLNSNKLKDIEMGLFTGKAGIASVLYEAGFKKDAILLLETSKGTYDKEDISIRSGLSGIGLAFYYMFIETKNSDYRDEVLIIASLIEDYFKTNKKLKTTDLSAIPIGLIDGWSGAALFFLHVYNMTREKHWLELAVKALELDFSQTKKDDNLKILQTLDDNKRLLPYLSGGSIGMAIPIWYLNNILDVDIFNEELEYILNINLMNCFYLAGLFDGAGSTLILSSITNKHGYLTNYKVDDVVINRLKLYLISRDTGIYCPGGYSYKLSLDLFSGSSGILLGLDGIEKKNPLNWIPLVNINSNIRSEFI